MNEARGFLIADADRVDTVLDGLARRIHAELDPDVRIVGILRRGAPLARSLGRRLSRLRNGEVGVGAIRFQRYAEDLSVIHAVPALGEQDLPFDLLGARILLVDDVLFSGRTFLQALQYLSVAGVQEVHLAVLCAREGLEVPIRAHFVGLHLEVGGDNVVEVHVPPYEEEWAVRLMRRKDLAP